MKMEAVRRRIQTLLAVGEALCAISSPLAIIGFMAATIMLLDYFNTHPFRLGHMAERAAAVAAADRASQTSWDAVVATGETLLTQSTPEIRRLAAYIAHSPLSLWLICWGVIVIFPDFLYLGFPGEAAPAPRTRPSKP
jgi:hypothetical protein